MPGLTLRYELARAARRGAKVRILLPGKSDVPAVRHASRHLYAWFMARGIEIHEWQPTILHTKYAAIDDRWATVGTYNLDYLSWRQNLEVNVAVIDSAIAHALRERFEQDLGRSLRIEPAVWAQRPWVDRGVHRFFFMFRKIL